MTEDVAVLPELRSRRDYFDYLDGYSVQTAQELYERRARRGLVKTYMLETVRDGESIPPIESTFRHSGLELRAIANDGLFAVSDPRKGGAVALLEFLDPRHPVLYTLMKVQESDPWVRSLVNGTPWLDQLWLSAPLFQKLWLYVKTTSHPRRFTRLSFEHEGFYERDGAPALDEVEDEIGSEEALNSSDTDEAQSTERRSSKFTMIDRVEVINKKLPALQNTYKPLYSITQLRIPAPNRGGHDFFFNGRATNRGDSFVDHRQNVEFVLGTYRRATEMAESVLWTAAESAPAGNGFTLKGSPVVMKFAETLPQATFERWILSTFGRKRDRFRLSGRPMWLGPGKVHVYGLDRHLWQPIMMEVTRDHVVVVLPKGTCGNTIHRLVTNIQHFLDPAIEVWVGKEPFQELVGRAIPYSPLK